MRRLLIGAGLLLAALTTQAQRKPNIVVILADDLGYGDIGTFGAKDIRTPNIDGLAEKGIKLTSFYSSSPVCSPTRAALITGRYPRRLGIDHVFFPESFTGIPSEEVTIAEALKGNGYRTAIFGKWHLGHHRQFLPLQNGFDEYYGIPYSNDMMGVAYLRGNEVDSIKVNQKYITHTYTKEAVRFIDQNKDKPFFLYITHNMPHVPIYASPKFEGKSKRGLYGDVIEELDWSVGEVVKALKKNGLEENTLVVFTSDNGPWLIFDVEGGSAGPLRQGKGTTFEGGQRVPAVAYWPGKIKPGTVYDDLASQLDLYPTIISLTGSQKTQTKKPLDGEDISPVLFGTGKRKGDEFAYYSNGIIEAYRKGDWKIRLPQKDVKAGNAVIVPAADTLLFNLKTDIGEQHNLLKSNPAKAKELLASLETYKNKIGETPPPLVQRMPSDDSHIKKRAERAAGKNTGK
ncbi:sulfatase family protein [Dyadobacter jiangsuensis]|uniref:Arylsulfatase A-like enzyme n=1 Tax=Dyadobacter jiangsuensis TaxID=1591085 RepID=A0A2P8G1K8_9BACT|nr:sulfatase [Dyadobacter jiangsuensis]PSL27872.1 arylsulfatase A-like enzyme [Dyadobacter jiangsuensis]